MSDGDGFDGEFLEDSARTALLAEAARGLAQQTVLLGGGRARDSEEARIAAEFARDRAAFGRPVVYRVEPDALDRVRQAMPVATDELSRRAAFYWVEFPISLRSGLNRGFNHLDVKVEFNPGRERRPVTFDVLPDPAWEQRFALDAKLSVGLSADLKVRVSVPEAVSQAVGLPVSGGAGAETDTHAGLVVGPFDYTIKVPKVTRTAPGNDHVFWSLDGTKFVEEGDPGLRVVLTVPHGVDELQIDAILQARRYYKLLHSGFREALAALPDRIKAFFKAGAPIWDRGSWNLTGEL